MKPAQRIAAVILTYRPDASVLRQAVVSLCPQVEQIVIVDNGTRWDSAGLLDGLTETERKRIDFIWLEQNLGVGAGHNRGIQWAKARGFSHVLIMDHDSVPRPDMVRHLVVALERLDAQGIPVSAVGPRYVDRYTGRMAGFVRLGRWRPTRVFCGSGRSGELLETDFIISSGSLIQLAVLDKVGEMNEGFFIDHVDTEWVLRAKAQGYRSFGVCDAVMEHSIGNATFRLWAGRWRNAPVHSPERDYYLFRNSINMYRMPHAPRRWIVNDIVRLVSMAVVFPLVAPERWRRIRLMARGIWHGLRGLTGPLQ
jgi:rhamnosyltransferase